MHIECDDYVYWPINVVMSPLTVVVNLSFASRLHINKASETQTTHKPDYVSAVKEISQLFRDISSLPKAMAEFLGVGPVGDWTCA